MAHSTSYFSCCCRVKNFILYKNNIYDNFIEFIRNYKGKSRNMANLTFSIAYLLYWTNTNYFYLLMDNTLYKEHLMDMNEGSLDYICILIWLFFGYKIDSMGHKNRKYI